MHRQGTAILFAVGAVSGTVLSFELGLLWPGFMAQAGAIIGMPFSLEGFAFFTIVCDRRAWIHWMKGAAMNRNQTSWILRIAAAVAVLVLLSAAFAAHGMAGEWRGHWGEGWHEHEVPHWGHGDIWRFHEGDLDRWHGGHWFHGEHFGRLGWWWIVDGAWYFYPAPVYPYPDPYVPPAVVTQVPPPPPTPSPPQYWYYCPSVKGYYPYVAECPEGWRPVAPQTPLPS